MRILLYLVFWPGYLVIVVRYFFPTEWGKGRNVSSSGRQFAHRDLFAGLYSIVIYGFVLFVFDIESYRAFGNGFVSGLSTHSVSKGAPNQKDDQGSKAPPERAINENGIRIRPEVIQGAELSDVNIVRSPTTTQSLIPPRKSTISQDSSLSDGSDLTSDSNLGESMGGVDVHHAKQYADLLAARERQAEYFGDDLIVRCRMGLPAKSADETRVRRWAVLVELSGGDEALAYSKLVKEDCVR